MKDDNEPSPPAAVHLCDTRWWSKVFARRYSDGSISLFEIASPDTCTNIVQLDADGVKALTALLTKEPGK